MSKPNPVFTDVVWNDVPKSWFDHSHKWEGTSDFNKLIPIYWDYFRPGDVIKGNVSIFGRSLPLKQPVFGDAYLHLDWFAVPLRLIWDNAAEFFQGTSRRGIPVSHPYPHITCPGEKLNIFLYNANGSLIDFFGGLTCWSNTDTEGQPIYTSPSNTPALFMYDAMPFRAYAEIWNEYFRDEQLQNLIVYGTGDGADSDTMNHAARVMPVCSEKDRFTTARPNPQFGSEASAPVLFDSLGPDGSSTVMAKIVGGDAQLYRTGYSTTSGPINGFTAISDLRAAIALQHLLETRNVGGFRYFEQVLSDFGVRMSDIRAQRPEFIGGDTVPFMINSVTQSSSNTDSSYLGQFAGQGMFSKDTDGIYYEANEDCIVMALMFVRPRAYYYQNVRKQFCVGIYDESSTSNGITSWMDKFYNPKLQGLGDEAVLQWEVAIGKDNTLSSGYPINAPFGYASQYSSWKCHNNEVHGEFKASLRDWVYTRDLVVDTPGFTQTGCDLVDLVQLDASDYRHVYAYNAITSDEDFGLGWQNSFSFNDHLLFDLSFGLEVRRSLEFYGTPGIGIV